MNYIITGDKGYIGSRLYKKMSSEPKMEGNKIKSDAFGLLDKKRGVQDDINNFNVVDESIHQHIQDTDVVYHLAAQAGAMPSWDDPYQDAMDNIMATIRVCGIFQHAKIVFTTSGAALDPESPYGLSKKTAEEYIKMLHDNAVILRLSSVYGEKDRGVVDNFIRDEVPTVYGDGSAVRDFVHVDDIVRALILAKDWEPGVYTLGSGKGTSVKELADATGKDIEYKPARKGEKQKVVLENTTPNWEPKINVIEYIEKMVE